MNVMLLDDDAELARLLESVLESDGMWVVPYGDPAEAVTAAVTGQWVAALVNVDLADGAAEAFLEVLSELDDVTLPIVLTSAEHKELAPQVQELMTRFGVTLFLRKPLPLLDLHEMLRNARDSGADLEACLAIGSSPSISGDLARSQTNEVAFEPASVSQTVTDVDVDPSSRRRRAMKGVLGGLQRGREGGEGGDDLVELSDGDLVPLSVPPDELSEVPLSGDAFDLEIEDEESEEVSVNQIHR